ncbi:DNA primase, partial [Candidatus Woesearchaeota archaeon]|nr:DNA primase [Candidatus Woesearchaeota archaeon]
ELRELQRSGRIGRIEVNVDTRSGKTKGDIIIPSSLDKAETSIVGAALEIIQRIGPCNAKIKVNDIEDVRVSKRSFVIERAKELLRQLTEKVLPDSQELADEVAYSVRVMELQQYGKDRLPAGPSIDDSDEIIIVEGRADVLNLLKHGIKNAIAMNGTSTPDTIKELTKKKIVTVFVDGDRGGDLIIKELLNVADLDYVTKAPDGKEVEEITKKEIHKALRGRITAEQAKMDLGTKSNGYQTHQSFADRRPQRPAMTRPAQPRQTTPMQRYTRKTTIPPLSTVQKTKFKSMLEDLIGTRGAYLLDEKLTILGKVPISELGTTVKSLSSGIYAIVFDGIVDKTLLEIAEKANVSYMVAMDSKITSVTKARILTVKNL